MWNFLVFRRMMTPVLIQIMFWLTEIGVVALGIWMLVKNRGQSQTVTVQQTGQQYTVDGLWLGIGILVIGPIVVRIFYEFLILIFRANETLTDIRNNTSALAQQQAGRPQQPF